MTLKAVKLKLWSYLGRLKQLSQRKLIVETPRPQGLDNHC